MKTKKPWYVGDKVKGIYCDVAYCGTIKNFRDVSDYGRPNAVIEIELDNEIEVYGQPRKVIEVYEKNRFAFYNIQPA